MEDIKRLLLDRKEFYDGKIKDLDKETERLQKYINETTRKSEKYLELKLAEPLLNLREIEVESGEYWDISEAIDLFMRELGL